MKRTWAIFWIFPLVLLMGCQKEIEPSGDPENGPAEDLDAKPITETTVGAEGGMLRNDQITVTIPEGAFLENQELTLSELTDPSFFQENLASKRFIIDGLPESFLEPIKIKISYSGTLSDESFAVTGEEGMDLVSGTESDFYNFLPVEDSGGYVICYLEGMDTLSSGQSRKSASGSDSGKKWISVEVLSHYCGLSIGKEITYKIYIPADREDDYSDQIADYLDYAHERINSAILTDNPLEQWADRYIFSYPVFVANLSGDDYCKFAWRNGSSDGMRSPKGILAINRNKMDDENADGDMMSLMIGRELFRACLFTFDPEYPTLRPVDQIPH